MRKLAFCDVTCTCMLFICLSLICCLFAKSWFLIDLEIFKKLELMFMKHYAPNRCLYIKVAKLRTGVGSAEM